MAFTHGVYIKTLSARSDKAKSPMISILENGKTLGFRVSLTVNILKGISWYQVINLPFYVCNTEINKNYCYSYNTNTS